jgi:hypothetical protein
MIEIWGLGIKFWILDFGFWIVFHESNLKSKILLTP